MHKNDILISAIVAMSDNNCIGREGKMPWDLPQDLTRLRELIRGKPLIMGRKTYESVLTYRPGGKPFPQMNIVISRSMSKPLQFPNVHVTSDLQTAFEMAKSQAAEDGFKEIFIFGGAEIYKLCLPSTDKIYLTLVHKTVEDGDAFFPELDPSRWHEAEREDHVNDTGLGYSFITLERAL
jgi:dihydrofolate reductase